MIDSDMAQRIAQLHALQVQIHEHHMAVLNWCAYAKNTKQHRDAIALMFRGQDLEKSLMDTLLAASVEATMLRTTLHEMSVGTTAQESFH